MYDHSKVEEKWQQIWETNQLFQQSEDVGVGKIGNDANDIDNNIYLLFAFAYPSGSGLHVGHVESKTALDILARYCRMKGKNVFFPVGWDAFGLPAENYAIKTGVHPSKTTVSAINTFRRQIKRIGISYDWANEIATSHPEYYKWTQWIFIQLFESWYCNTHEESFPISELVDIFEEEGNVGLNAKCGKNIPDFSAEMWNSFSEEKKQKVLGKARSAIGRAQRAEKIRTYNFPQNRITDHRSKQSWHNLPLVLDGDLSKLMVELHPAMNNIAI